MIIKRPTIAIGSEIASLVLVEPVVMDNAPASVLAVSLVEVAQRHRLKMQWELEMESRLKLKSTWNLKSDNR